MTSQNNQAGLPLPGFGNAANTRHTGRRSSRRPFFRFARSEKHRMILPVTEENVSTSGELPAARIATPLFFYIKNKKYVKLELDIP